jgi:hypothetical protein
MMTVLSMDDSVETALQARPACPAAGLVLVTPPLRFQLAINQRTNIQNASKIVEAIVA